MSENAAYLRGQARRCRRLARGAPDVAETLERMAVEYDARAEALERKAGQ